MESEQTIPIREGRPDLQRRYAVSRNTHRVYTGELWANSPEEAIAIASKDPQLITEVTVMSDHGLMSAKEIRDEGDGV